MRIAARTRKNERIARTPDMQPKRHRRCRRMCMHAKTAVGTWEPADYRDKILRALCCMQMQGRGQDRACLLPGTGRPGQALQDRNHFMFSQSVRFLFSSASGSPAAGEKRFTCGKVNFRLVTRNEGRRLISWRDRKLI